MELYSEVPWMHHILSKIEGALILIELYLCSSDILKSTQYKCLMQVFHPESVIWFLVFCQISEIGKFA